MEPASPRRASARAVDRALSARGLEGRVQELPASTRTADDAALAVGCETGQIVKSLVFRGRSSGRPLLALVAGDHRLDEGWMARFTGEPIERADPEFVRSASGFAIGGVPPLGHPAPLATFIDYDLLERREIWAAAGHPNAVCRLSPTELLEVTDGRPVPVVPLAIPDGPDRPWVSFDCFGTLVDWRTGLLRSLDRAIGTDLPTVRDRLFATYLAEERRIEAGPYRSYRQIVPAALAGAARAVDRDVDPEWLGRVVDDLPDWPLFDDTAVALDLLRGAGRSVAILSNIDRDLLDVTLRHHGLRVDLTVTAEDTRSYKPAPAHWIRFLKSTGASPSETLHCAGAYDYDLPPAARLGFRTAYIERFPGAPYGPAAGTVVPDLRALLSVVGIEPGGGSTELARGP